MQKLLLLLIPLFIGNILFSQSLLGKWKTHSSAYDSLAAALPGKASQNAPFRINGNTFSYDSLTAQKSYYTHLATIKFNFKKDGKVIITRGSNKTHGRYELDPLFPDQVIFTFNHHRYALKYNWEGELLSLPYHAPWRLLERE